MKKNKLLVNRPLVVSMACAILFAGIMPVSAGDAITLTGPEGNTVTVTDTSISGSIDGLTGTVTDSTATASTASSSTSDDGGGSSSNTGVIIAAVAVVAVGAGLFYWWHKKHHAAADQIMEKDSVVLCRLNKSASVTVTPGLVHETSRINETRAISLDDLADAALGLRVAF